VAVPGVRECFVARPGYALVSVDYDAFEMSAWAQVCLDLVGQSVLAEILADPARDLHVEMAAQIHNMPAAELYALKKTDPKKFKDLRQIGKPANFGLLGGLGPARFVEFAWAGYGLTLTEQQARTIKQKWAELYTEAKPYFELIGEQVGREGRGRITQLRSGRVRGGCSFTAAANGYVQSLAADAAKEAGWRLTYEMYAVPESPLYGSRMIAFVHDEYILEVPLDRLHEAAMRQAQVQVEAAKVYMPDVRVSASPAAMYRWQKGADAAYDSNGRLIPWEDRE
jgi:DNA polymerase-1